MNREYINYIEQVLGFAEQSDYFGISLVEFESFSQEVLIALKKQIPRKVDTEITEIGGVQHTCQSCWGFVGYLYEYCQNCGQKLDWSEE